MRRDLMKKLLLVVSLIAVTLMAGCGKKQDAEHRINKEAIYRENVIPIKLPEEVYASGISMGNDLMYIRTYSNTGETKPCFYTCKSDGTELTEHVINDPNAWIEYIAPLADNSAYILYSSYVEDDSDPENYDYMSYYYLSLYDSKGNEVKKLDVSDKFSWASNVLVLEDKLLISSDSSLYMFDKDLNLIKQKDDDSSNLGSIYKLPDGSFVCTCYGDEGELLKKFDIDKLEMGEEIVLTNVELWNYQIYEGMGYDLFLKDNTSIYGLKLSDSSLTEVLNFVDSDISTSYFEVFVPLSDNEFLGAYYDYEESEDGGMVIAKYTKIPASEVVDKKVITLGCLYLDNTVRKKVIDFNRSNPDYRITVKDYSIYDSEDDYEASSRTFNNDVASGKAPDIVISNDSTLIHNYISKGLYKDLTEYINNDPEINFDDMFPNIVQAGSTDGKFYEIIPSFSIQTMAAKTKLLNGITGWNMEELRAFEKTLPENSSLLYGTTREEFMDYMLSVNGESYVDNVKGEVSFDSPEFIELLKFVSELPEGNDEFYEKLEEEGYWDNYDTLWRDNRVILYQTYTSSFSGYNYYQQGTFGEDITFVGCPSEDRNGSCISYYFSAGMSSKCKDPDAAWQFLRTYLLPDYQKEVGTYEFPALMSVFDEYGKKAMEKKSYQENGEMIYDDDTYYRDGEWVTLDPIKQADIDKIKNLIVNTTKVSGSMNDISEIINEEAQAFFEGQKTAEDVVKIIQSRASIFIKEKR